MLLGWIALMAGGLYATCAVSLERYGRRAIRDGDRFDAIVVAGCAVQPDGKPSLALAERTAHAVRLHAEGHAERVVFTGGVGARTPDGPSEAAAAARFAREELGLPAAAIVLEEASTSTEENARLAAEILGAEARVLVVSDAYHVYRCERVFRRYFREAYGTGSRGRPAARARGALREVGALTAYALLGRL